MEKLKKKGHSGRDGVESSNVKLQRQHFNILNDYWSPEDKIICPLDTLNGANRGQAETQKNSPECSRHRMLL